MKASEVAKIADRYRDKDILSFDWVLKTIREAAEDGHESKSFSPKDLPSEYIKNLENLGYEVWLNNKGKYATNDYWVSWSKNMKSKNDY